MAKGNKSSKKVKIDPSQWDNNKKFDLINEVRRREQLWNHFRVDYHRRDLTDKNWEEVATEEQRLQLRNPWKVSPI